MTMICKSDLFCHLSSRLYLKLNCEHPYEKGSRFVRTLQNADQVSCFKAFINSTNRAKVSSAHFRFFSQLTLRRIVQQVTKCTHKLGQPHQHLLHTKQRRGSKRSHKDLFYRSKHLAPFDGVKKKCQAQSDKKAHICRGTHLLPF